MTIGIQNQINAEQRYQNWGVDKPIPELEAVIAELNQLRASPRHGVCDWEDARRVAFKKAGRLLKVKAERVGSGSSRWNPTINALTLYRADWRGFAITTILGGAA